MAFKYHIVCVCLALFIFCVTTSSIQPTKLVDEVCHSTSSYSLCVESLCTDPRTPSADRYVLAYISFRLAFLNASSTQDHIAKLLKHTEAKAKAKAKANTGPTQQVLRRCYHDYNKAVSALSSAYNDLNSETFSDLVDWAGAASLAADDCQVVVKTTYPPLSTMNLDLKRLCEICVAVSKLFT
ncbi:cell wall / vacuolar inhibitor of fructosidase 2-like [Prunus dulcis]|uniref:cell wall / vacuolar inhibitor of fructosidase 2-like n=1 Tax=Prunus dulcis TaxID=3755 RepID=UPI001482F712|nr:cell wall / vacuolar inhibitor of fructosidase 2-like [Prunus dulcis]